MVLQVAGAVGQQASKTIVKNIQKKRASTKKGKGDKPKRRRVRLLTLGQREELMWIARHLGRSAAAERMVHYRR